jgi:predicted O-methyltransferase YrrM
MKRAFGFIKRYFYAGASCLYLFTIGLFATRNRMLISSICEHFGYSTSARAQAPEIELSEILSDSVPIQLHGLNYVDGNVTLIELMVITNLIQQYQPKRLFEIGTFDGRTTLNMAANCSPESKVYTLDLPKADLSSTGLTLDAGDAAYINKELSGERYSGTEYEGKITQLYGDSAKFDFSQWYGSIDFIFIDGSHAYDYVLNDTKEAFKLLNPKGQKVILWHDYGAWDGVTKALNKLYATDGRFAGLRHVKGTTLGLFIL